MTYLRTVPPAEAVGEVRAMYEHQQAHLGYVPNYARAFGHRPEVMRRWAPCRTRHTSRWTRRSARR